jgi:uracil-DNA glycosylase family 4
MICTRCPALCASRTRIVLPDLPEFGRPHLLVIGEAPGADEDQQGRGFVGRAGRTLHRLLEANGLSRGYDYGCANVVRCRPPDNRKPTAEEVQNCLPFLSELLAKVQPAVVLAVGDTAAAVFFQNRRGLSLGEKIQALQESDHCPRAFLEYGSLLDLRWPFGSKLVVMPHTSPLAWNRSSPDGRKWSEVGEAQIRLAANLVRSATTP